MLYYIKMKLKRIKDDDKGSAIVLVIIALAMVGILAVTIMWLSMTNYYMKVTDKGNKQGFYSSETVLEQIKAGLEEDASMAASRAYAYILAKDYSTASTADRNYDFKDQYKDFFVDIVCVHDPSTNLYKYDLDHLLEYVDPAIRPETSARQSTGKVRYMTSKEADAAGETGYGKLVYDDATDMIKLEGIHLEFTDEDGRGNDYVSIIDTDIIVSTPDVSFTQTSVIPDVFEYAIVADKQLLTMSNSKTEVKGSIYAGDDGILLGDELKIKDANYVISKGDIIIGRTDAVLYNYPGFTIKDGTNLTITGKSGVSNTEFWANDIALGNGRTSLNTNKVDTYVADDITLSGRKAKVKMEGGGKYIGYGNSENVAAKSSAVVVNGIGSTVHMEGLDEVTLLGRAFVSIPQKWALSDGSVSQDSVDIKMGESIAVKGEQVAFLVPDGCVFVTEADGSHSQQVSNPFVRNMLLDSSGFATRKLKVSLTDELKNYVDDPSNGYKLVYPETSNLCYVYMTMTGDKANDYYANEYYKENSGKIDNYFMVYTDRNGTDKKIEVPEGTKMNSEGDFLTAYEGYSTTEADKVIEGADSKSQLNLSRPISDKDALNSECVRIRDNLCAKLVKEGVVHAELSNTLFDNIIRRSELDALVSNSLNGNPFEFKDTTNTYKVVFAKNDGTTPYEYSDKNIRVLVVDGDVNINDDFTGVLIASGKVTISKSDAKITSIVNADATGSTELDRMKSALVTVRDDVYVTVPGVGSTTKEKNALMYFVDGSEYDLDGIRRNSTSTVSHNKVEFTELVKFNNWVKN